jgi:precorrin-6A/cobalt-precorrin-6A reductase
MSMLSCQIRFRHLLLLGGSAEARRIAAGLAGSGRVTLSLSRPPRAAETADMPVRIGGFGGGAGLTEWLDAEGVDAVLDATHPFAGQMTTRAAQLCRKTGRAYLRVMRPPWRPGPGDRWTEVAGSAEAARHIPPGTQVFSTLGRGMLDGFAALRGGHVHARLLTDAPPDAPRRVSFVPGPGPFSVQHERALFERLSIGALVCRNSGGEGGRSKLDAARALGVPVYLVRRPAPQVPFVPDVASALAWARG